MANKKELIQALREFDKAAKKLDAAWEGYEHLGAGKFPFTQSFDAVAIDISEWVSRFVEDLQTEQ